MFEQNFSKPRINFSSVRASVWQDWLKKFGQFNFLGNTYDCENDEEPPCNFDVLDYLENQKEDEDDDTPPDGSIWDALKDLK